MDMEVSECLSPSFFWPFGICKNSMLGESGVGVESALELPMLPGSAVAGVSEIEISPPKRKDISKSS